MLYTERREGRLRHVRGPNACFSRHSSQRSCSLILETAVLAMQKSTLAACDFAFPVSGGVCAGPTRCRRRHWPVVLGDAGPKHPY